MQNFFSVWRTVSWLVVLGVCSSANIRAGKLHLLNPDLPQTFVPGVNKNPGELHPMTIESQRVSMVDCAAWVLQLIARLTSRNGIVLCQGVHTLTLRNRSRLAKPNACFQRCPTQIARHAVPAKVPAGAPIAQYLLFLYHFVFSYCSN